MLWIDPLRRFGVGSGFRVGSARREFKDANTDGLHPGDLDDGGNRFDGVFARRRDGRKIETVAFLGGGDRFVFAAVVVDEEDEDFVDHGLVLKQANPPPTEVEEGLAQVCQK